MYGDKITPSMKRAIDETERRRKIQIEYNKKHNITPETIIKSIKGGLSDMFKARKIAQQAVNMDEQEFSNVEIIAELEKQMLAAAEALDFEKAAKLRDKLKEFQAMPQLKAIKNKQKRKK